MSTRNNANGICKCCDEVKEELVMMRQTFEKLREEIIGLRRDVSAVLEKPSDAAKKVIQPTEPIKQNSKSDKKEKVIAKPARASPMDPMSYEEEISFYEEPLITSDFCCSDTDSESTKKKIVKRSKPPKTNTNQEKTSDDLVNNTARSVLDFFNIQARVMPTQPFRDPKEFEDWNILLRNDEDQRDQLRVELMEGNYKAADQFISHIWRSVLHFEAGWQYSYTKSSKNRKRMRDFIFTDIFKEVFLQRFYNMDVEFFVERTMRFFKYASDQKRKAEAKKRKNNGKDTGSQKDAEEQMDDE